MANQEHSTTTKKITETVGRRDHPAKIGEVIHNPLLGGGGGGPDGHFWTVTRATIAKGAQYGWILTRTVRPATAAEAAPMWPQVAARQFQYAVADLRWQGHNGPLPVWTEALGVRRIFIGGEYGTELIVAPEGAAVHSKKYPDMDRTRRVALAGSPECERVRAAIDAIDAIQGVR